MSIQTRMCHVEIHFLFYVIFDSPPAAAARYAYTTLAGGLAQLHCGKRTRVFSYIHRSLLQVSFHICIGFFFRSPFLLEASGSCVVEKEEVCHKYTSKETYAHMKRAIQNRATSS